MRPRYADLFRALKDPDPTRVDAAYDALLFDRADAIPELAEAYKTFKRDAELRFYAVQLLAFSEDSRAVPYVMEALSDPDPSVRAEACRAVEDLMVREAVPALRARTEDLDASVREAAREALDALTGAADD